MSVSPADTVPSLGGVRAPVRAAWQSVTAAYIGPPQRLGKASQAGTDPPPNIPAADANHGTY